MAYTQIFLNSPQILRNHRFLWFRLSLWVEGFTMCFLLVGLRASALYTPILKRSGMRPLAQLPSA